MTGNIESQNPRDAEKRRAQAFHEILVVLTRAARTTPDVTLFRQASPLLAEQGIEIRQWTFIKTLAKWRKNPEAETLVRKRVRTPMDSRPVQDLRPARILHAMLTATVEAGRHISTTRLWESLAPIMAGHGISMTPREFSIVFAKWRKDQRPETLTHTHPCRHRSSLATNLKNIRVHAIRRGITLEAAWREFKAAKVTACPPLAMVLRRTEDEKEIADLARQVRKHDEKCELAEKKILKITGPLKADAEKIETIRARLLSTAK